MPPDQLLCSLRKRSRVESDSCKTVGADSVAVDDDDSTPAGFPPLKSTPSQSYKREGHRVPLVGISDTHTRHKTLNQFLPPHDPSMHTILLRYGDFSDRGST
eukprot:scaffold24022_cov168-Amphora_coffeaeformis.AAC.18